MQLKQIYDIATELVAEKSATTFGDLPDCLCGWRRWDNPRNAYVSVFKH